MIQSGSTFRSAVFGRARHGKVQITLPAIEMELPCGAVDNPRLAWDFGLEHVLLYPPSDLQTDFALSKQLLQFSPILG